MNMRPAAIYCASQLVEEDVVLFHPLVFQFRNLAINITSKEKENVTT